MSRVLISQIICFLVLPAFCLAESYHCENSSHVEVLAPDPLTEESVCLAAQKTIDFLGRYQLAPQRMIRVKIVEERIDSHGYLAYGSYDRRSDSVELMSLAAIRRGSAGSKMYGEAFDKVHYQGAIAHELTHAIFQHHVQTEQISTAAQEYLACATQLAVLPAPRRDQLIRAMQVSAWESGDSISDAYLAMQPGKFAVKSYLHLTSLQDPTAFIQILLRAKWFYVDVP